LTSLRGGQGQIFEAFDTQFDRQVLVKKLSADAAAGGGQNRFRREAKVTAQLQHPGIVPVYDYFEDDEDTPCCVMEYVFQGGAKDSRLANTLDDLIRDPNDGLPSRSNETFRRLVEALELVSETVAYAHACGFVHRDLKCSNILITDTRVVVLDWGVVKLLDSPDLDASQYSLPNEDATQAGDNVGTQLYMSPEQARDPTQVDERSDVYSLGVILYRILTGQLPEKCLRDDPPPRSVAPKTPKSLEAICLKAMSYDPKDRYASANLFAHDLSNWLSDRRISAYSSWLDDLWRLARGYQTLVATVVALVVVSCLALLVMSTFLIQANAALDQSADENRVLSDEKSIQLVRIQDRQYSSTLREAGDLLENRDPVSAAVLLNDIELCPPRLREFTWRLLDKAARSVHHLENTDSPPRHLQFLGNGKNRALVFGDVNGNVVFWGGPDFEQREIELIVPTAISALAVTARPPWKIVVGTRAGEIVVADQSGTLIQRIQQHKSTVKLVGFHKTSGDMVSGDTNGKVNVWALSSSTPKATYEIPGEVLRYGYSSENNLIAAGRRGGSVYILDANSGTSHEVDKTIGFSAGAISFYRGGKMLAISQRSGDVQMISTESVDSPHNVGVEHQFDTVVRHLDVTHDGDYEQFVASSKEEGVHISSPGVRGWLPLKVRPKRYITTSLCFSSDGQYLAFGHADSKLSIWKLNPLAPNKIVHAGFNEGLQEVTCFDWRGDSKATIWGTRHGSLLFDSERGDEIKEQVSITSIDVAPVEVKVLASREDRTVQLWNGSQHALVVDRVFDAKVLNALFIPSNRVGVLTEDGFHVLDQETFEPVYALTLTDFGRERALSSLDASRDLAVIRANRELFCLDLKRGKILWKATCDTSKIEHHRVFPNGERFVTCQRSGAIRLWDMKDGSEIRVLQTQAGPIKGVAVSPDGKTLATVDRSGQVELIDADLGATRLTLRVPQPRAIQVEFSNDGNSLAVATRSGIFVWSVD